MGCVSVTSAGAGAAGARAARTGALGAGAAAGAARRGRGRGAGGFSGVVPMTWISGSVVALELPLELAASWAARVFGAMANTTQSARSNPRSAALTDVLVGSATPPTLPMGPLTTPTLTCTMFSLKLMIELAALPRGSGLVQAMHHKEGRNDSCGSRDGESASPAGERPQ
jgi:hypothetical protein